MRLFVAGTDTGVGKTVVSALLARSLRESGRAVIYQKWVTTGSRDHSGDALVVKEFAGLNMETQRGSLFTPLCFSYPASPHLAAELDGEEPDIGLIMDSYHRLSSRDGWLIVEGAGGLMVPLTRELLLIDLLQEARIPVLLVSRSGLGTINHTLLSLEALGRRNIPVAGIVFNTTSPGPAEIAADNARVVEEFSKVPVVGRLPLLRDWRREWEGRVKGLSAGIVGEIERRLKEVGHGQE